MKILSSIVIVLALVSCNNRLQKFTDDDMACIYSYDRLNGLVVYTKVNKAPEFPGGQDALFNFLSSNFKAPLDFDYSTIRLEFIVDLEGKIIGERIKNKNINQISSSENEALRVIKSSPKWIPGECNGDKVNCMMQIPIKI